MSKYRRIVAYGCSFTAGDEINDHLQFPDSEQLKKKNIEDWLLNYGPKLTTEIKEKNKQDSYAGQLATLMRLPLVNNAIGGTGLFRHSRQFIKDLQTNQLGKHDLVVFGLTSIGRLMYLNPSYDRDIMMNRKVLHNIPVDFDFIVKFFTDEMLLFNYYGILLELLHLAERNQINAIFVNAAANCNLDPTKYLRKESMYFDELMFLYNQIKSHENVFLNTSLIGMIRRGELYAAGHPTYEVHSRFAAYLKSLIKDD